MGPAGHSIERINQTGLAVGERVHASGKEIIAAVATVFELGARFAYAATAVDARGRVMKMRHQILLCALVSGKLMKLDETQMNNLVGLAWMISPPVLGLGLGSMVGNTANVMVCPVGVQAALLARNGFTGPLDVLERADTYDLEALAASPAPYHYLTQEMYLKPWIAPGGTSHHAIDLAVSIVREEGLRPDDIDEIKLLVREPELDESSVKPSRARRLLGCAVCDPQRHCPDSPGRRVWTAPGLPARFAMTPRWSPSPRRCGSSSTQSR